MGKLNIMVVFGTRPEAIKMAPLILELKKHQETINTITVVTAQHRQMLDQVLDTFEIVPDYDLDIMGKNQSLQEITSKILSKFDPVVKKEKPDFLVSTGAGAAVPFFYIGVIRHGFPFYCRHIFLFPGLRQVIVKFDCLFILKRRADNVLISYESVSPGEGKI